jgi:hypothetical protein
MTSSNIIGLQYNGSKSGLGNQNWWHESGIYAIKANNCSPDRVKIGFSSRTGTSQMGIGKRLGDQASALVEMSILLIVNGILSLAALILVALIPEEELS